MNRDFCHRWEDLPHNTGHRTRVRVTDGHNTVWSHADISNGPVFNTRQLSATASASNITTRAITVSGSASVSGGSTAGPGSLSTPSTSIDNTQLGGLLHG